MALKTIDDLFQGREWDGLHDVIVDTLNVKPTVEQAKNVFLKLPENIQMIAFEWGMGDTVFRDETYKAIQDNGITLVDPSNG